MKKKGGEDTKCRYHYPRHLREEAIVTKEIDYRSLRFGPSRNHTTLNDYNATIVLAWQGNTDL